MFTKIPKRLFYWTVIFFVTPLMMLLLSSGSIYAQGIDEPGEGFVEIEDISEAELLELDTAVKFELDPSFKFHRARHVANGVAMRKRTSGTIHLRGVPVGSRILKALLYWNFLDQKVTGARRKPVLFNGNRLLGLKTADTVDPCWYNVVASHTYRADVTSFVNTTSHPNQDYEVVLNFNRATNTSGQSPWGFNENEKVHIEGATLVVIYEAEDGGGGPLYVYDNLYNTMFTSSATFELYHDAVSEASGLFTMVGADGQRGGGHDNFSSNEITFFNGTQIAGPPVASSDWDGSEGLPLPQLWDTHTHVVNLAGFSAKVDYFTPGDCLVPVAFVLDFN